MSARHIQQADLGCDFDFLETSFGAPVGEPDIFWSCYRPTSSTRSPFRVCLSWRLRLALFLDSGSGGRLRRACAVRLRDCSSRVLRFLALKCMKSRPSPKLMDALTAKKMMLEVSMNVQNGAALQEQRVKIV